MDPVGVKLDDDDLIAPDFPVPHAFGTERRLPGPIEGTDPDETVEGDPDSASYLIGDWFSPNPSRPLHSTRCVAVSKRTGQRCRAWAVIGFERCVKHSGYTKLANLKEYRERVIERARLDLLKGAPYAVERLVELSRDREINPAVSLKASTEILDRVGVKGGADLNITVESDATQTPAEIIRARLDRLASAAAITASEANGPAAGETEITEAEVISDDDAV